MRIRSSFSSKALFTLMSTVAFVTPAMAQKGLTLAPTTHWAVNKTAAAGTQAGYCAIARRFRPNTILTLAKNPNGETSFAIDFQGPKFKQSEAMQVNLDPGAGQQRAFEVYPISNQAFVIRLGQDNPFFTALDKTGYLRIEFGGQSYNFDLSDIDDGHTKLETCVASMISPAAGDEEPVTQQAAASSDSSYRTEINNLRSQLQQLRDENQRLQNVSSGAPVVPAPVTSEPLSPEPVVMPAKENLVAIEHLTTRITALEQENQGLKSSLAQANSSAAAAPRRSPEDLKMIESLKQENASLQAAVQSKESAATEARALSDEIARLKDDNRRLQQIADGAASKTAAEGAANDQAVAKLAAENARLEEQLALKSADAGQIDVLKQKLAALEAENKSLQGQVVTAQAAGAAAEDHASQLASLKEENARLQSVVQAKTQEASKVAELESKIATLEAQNTQLATGAKTAADLQAQTGDHAAELQGLRAELAKLTTEIQDKDKKLVEMSALSVEIEGLKATNSELQQKLVSGAAQNGEAAELLKKVAALESENNNLVQQLQAASEKPVADDGQVASLKAENERLQKELAHKTDATVQVNGINAELEMLRQDNADLLAKLEAQAGEGDTAAKLQAALDENKHLQEQLAQKGDDAAQAVSLKADVERLKKENETLIAAAQEKPQVQPVQAEASLSAQEQAELKGLREENKGLKQKISSLESKDQEITELKSRLEQQDAKIKQAQSDAKEAERRADAAEASENPAPVKQAAIAEPETPKKKPAKVKPAEPVVKVTENEAVIEERTINSPVHDSNDQAPGAEDFLEFEGKQAPPADPVQAAPGHDGEHADAASVEDPKKVKLDGVDYNEAQKYEQSMKESIAQVPSSQAPQEEELSLRASEDPFADIKSEDGFTGYKSDKGGAVKEQTADVGESAVPASVSAPETIEAKGAGQPSSEQLIDVPQGHGVTHSNQNEAAVFASGPVEVPQILAQAQIAPAQGVNIVPAASTGDKKAYQWTSENIFGSAIQQPLANPDAFDDEVKAYLENTQKRCPVDFAIVPDDSVQVGDTRIDTYDIACIGNGVNSSASLIFFNKNGTFTVLANEAPAEKLDTAMGMKERLIKTIKGS